MLKQRLITGLILVTASVGVILFANPMQFALFIGAIVLLAAYEWACLVSPAVVYRSVFVAVVASVMLVLYFQPSLWLPICCIALVFWLLALFWVIRYPKTQWMWSHPAILWICGLLILLPAWSSLVLLRSQLSQPSWLLYAIALVWVADTGAYFSGRAFGRRKLAPNVSPGKSFAGAYGGVFAAVLFSLVASQLAGLALVSVLSLALVTALVAVFSILGDLFESMIKRRTGVKDSGSLLPGHGGVLDRVDALTCAMPVFAVCYMLLLVDVI